MNTTTPSNNSAADLKAKITERIQELAEATDAARISAEMLRYLDTCAKFHKYSMFNVIQILMTRPDATSVAGFKKWQTMGRYVRKGEHGIPILAPIFSVVTDDHGAGAAEGAEVDTVTAAGAVVNHEVGVALD